MTFFAIQLVLGFYSRKIFLNYLGTEVLGLNTTATNILELLNIAELGIGAAVGFSLYKPLLDNDHSKICDIVSLQGHFYRRIAIGIIVCSLCVMAAFPWIFHKITLPLWYAYASFSVLLISALLGYFVNYRQIVLSSAQMDYKIRYSQTSWTIVKVACQMAAVAMLDHPYQWWLLFELIFTLIGAYSLHRATHKAFPFLRQSQKTYCDLKKEYSFIITKVKQVFFHKIGGFAMTQTSPLIIYAYISLDMVALYGNYLLITSGIIRLSGAVFNSIGAGIGNLVAEGNIDKITTVFRELFSMRFVFSATLTFTTIMIAQDFVKLWVGGEYLLPFSTLAILCGTLFISLLRSTVDLYINAYGLYQDIWAPVAEAAINIGLSLLLGYHFGLNGILAGVLISLCLVMGVWKPFFLFRYGLKTSVGIYFKIFIEHLFVAILVAAAVAWIATMVPIDPSASYGALALYTAICALSFLVLFSAIACAFRMGLNRFLSRIFTLILKK